MYEGVPSLYSQLSYFMVDQGILDPLNNLHIAALHHVYLLRINEKLGVEKCFVQASYEDSQILSSSAMDLWPAATTNMDVKELKYIVLNMTLNFN